MTEYRTEKDTMGDVKVPKDAYYGAQTQRAVENFPVSGQGLPRYFIASDLAARRLVRLMPRVRLRSDSFRLVWRAGHPREAELMALAAELRAFPLR